MFKSRIMINLNNPIYTGNFTCDKDIVNEFATSDFPKDLKIIFADYDCPPYEGYAYVLYYQGGNFYEVHGSHCSCYGLEDQWEPELITLNDLKFRMENGNIREELKPILNVLLRGAKLNNILKK